MSQDLQMTISARDQASQVIQGVEKRVANFGKQFGQQLVGMVAPMALVGMAIAKIGQHFEELAQKRKEAFDWGASLEISANKMGVTVEAFQAIEAAADVTGESVDKVGKSFKLASDLIASARGGNLEAIPVPHIVGKAEDAVRLLAPWADRYHDLKNQAKDDLSGASAIYSRAAEHVHKLALTKRTAKLTKQ